VSDGAGGNLIVSQTDAEFAKLKVEVGDAVKVSWQKRDQLELAA